MTNGVPAADRLLDPDEVVNLFDLGHIADGLLEIPGLIRVEHEARLRDVDSKRIADDAQPANVAGNVPAALELPAREPTARHLGIEAGELIVIERDIQSGRIPGDEPIAPPEQAPKRLARELGLDIPQRHVKGADTSECRAGMARLEHAREHAVVERGYRAGILALDRREDLRQVLVRAHSDAADALIRVHDDNRHLGDT